jgi:hypothetical protein
MTLILSDLPYSDQPGTVTVGGEVVQALPHQVLVWVSVCVRGLAALDRATPRFPAILDTGNTFGFALAERRLTAWSGCPVAALGRLGDVLINRNRVPRLAADVWLHRNRKGQRGAFRPVAPFRVELRDGVAVYPLDAPFPVPRLPILGMRAIDENRLRLVIDGERLRVTLRAPREE